MFAKYGHESIMCLPIIVVDTQGVVWLGWIGVVVVSVASTKIES